MPDTKISAETAGSPIAGPEQFVATQSGGNVKFTAAQLADFARVSLLLSASFSDDVALTADDSDVIPSQHAVRSFASNAANLTVGIIPIARLPLDTDVTLAANSDSIIATQKATKAYIDQLIAAADAMVFKGAINCSANPNYPAADRGWTYKVSVAGKIGGASGVNVEVGDTLMCLTDGTASGTQAGVGANWNIVQANLDGAVIGPASATDGHLAQFDGVTGKLIKGGLALDVDSTLAADSDTRIPSQKAVKAALALKADLASPALTGNPTVPTQTAGNNSTRAASTAFVQTAIAGSVAGVSDLNGQTGAVAAYFRPQGRLTLQTAVPVMVTTQSAKTTIYYSPYAGDMVPLYDGTYMVPRAFTEISVATTDTTKNPAAIGASKVNDWFVWSDSGTLRLCHGPDWTSDAARSAGTALVMVKGVLLNNATITNGPAASRGTYVGTTRSNGSSQLDWILGAAASGGTAGLLNVWNTYNRILVASLSGDSAAQHTYTTATVRAWNAGTGMACSFVKGLDEDVVDIAACGQFNGVALNATAYGGIGLDSTTVFTSRVYVTVLAGLSAVQPCMTGTPWQSGIGYHTASLLELGDGTNANGYGGGGAIQNFLRAMTLQ